MVGARRVAAWAAATVANWLLGHLALVPLTLPVYAIGQGLLAPAGLVVADWRYTGQPGVDAVVGGVGVVIAGVYHLVNFGLALLLGVPWGWRWAWGGLLVLLPGTLALAWPSLWHCTQWL